MPSQTTLFLEGKDQSIFMFGPAGPRPVCGTI